MVDTSENYKIDFYKDFRNNSYCNISFKIEETAPRAECVVRSNLPETDYSTNNPFQSNLAPRISYATLEGNRLKLDGSLTVYNENDVLNSSFVSAILSDENGEFDINPIITISTREFYSYAGLTLLFDEYSKEYAIDFEIKAYTELELKDTKTVTNNTEYKYIYINNYENIDRITIEFKKVLPYHRARLSYLTFGIENTFDNDNLLDDGLVYTNKVDPLSRELPENSLEFTIENYEHLYNADNPDGLFQYLHENLEIKAKLGYKLDNQEIEWVNLGTFYLNEWEADDNTARFKGIGLLNTLTNIYSEEAPITTVITPVSIYDKLITMINYEGLNYNVNIDDSLMYIMTTATIPEVSVAEVFQYCANACRCILYTGRDNIIYIKPYDTIYRDFVLDDDLLDEEGRNLELDNILKNVNVNWYIYALGNSKTIYSGEAKVNKTTLVTIKLDKPAQNITASVSGAELLTYTANYQSVIVAIYSENSTTAYITLNGVEIEATEQTLVKRINNNGEDATITNPLITSQSVANEVAIYTSNFLNNRKKYNLSYRGSPEVDSCDILKLDTKFSLRLPYIVTSNIIKFNGGITGEMEGRVI